MTAGGDPVIGVDGSAPQWQDVDTLGLADVIVTILRARRSLPAATAAEVAREQHQAVTRVRVSLRREPPLGPGLGGQARAADPPVTIARFKARELGADLAEAFRDRDVIVLK